MSESRTFKSAAYEHLAGVGKALADPTRIELLELVAQAPRSVDSLAEAVGHSVANTSHHLQVLKKARLVVAQKDGLHRFYEVSGPEVASLVDALQTAANRHVEDLRVLKERFFAERDGLEPIGADELLRRLADEDAVLVDVRPSREFEAGHVPGALSIPVEELTERFGELPVSRTVVAYCRGPFCTFSADAVKLLRRHGFDALRFEGTWSQARDHWEKVYAEKDVDSVSWYRPHLDRSLEYIERCEAAPDARIVDIGGGASTWPDDLLERGWHNLAVVDISKQALERSQERLGERAREVDWVVGDARGPIFEKNSVDVWHDRAVLHFMQGDDVGAYVDAMKAALKPGGHAVIATFSPDGPTRCSGLEVTQYSADDLRNTFGDEFVLIDSSDDVHETPWGSEQRFTYALLKKTR